LIRLCLLAVWLYGGVALAHAAGVTPVGRWFSTDHSIVVEIAPCGQNLCGRIVGIVLAHPGDPLPMDWLGRPQCGMTLLETARVPNPRTGGTNWIGTILDPRNGDVYRATITVDDAHHLRLHGYIGLPIFGLTQSWTPYSGQILANCTLAPANK
jgi:uncharacterized protein (DUF2147 family)